MKTFGCRETALIRALFAGTKECWMPFALMLVVWFYSEHSGIVYLAVGETIIYLSVTTLAGKQWAPVQWKSKILHC